MGEALDSHFFAAVGVQLPVVAFLYTLSTTAKTLHSRNGKYGFVDLAKEKGVVQG
jgi:hypothetical protein